MAEEPSEGAELPADGTDAGDALRAAQDAFHRGAYAEVRKLTKPLLDHDDADVARHAHDLQRRVQIDPAQVVTLLLCLGFFGWVVWKYVLS